MLRIIAREFHPLPVAAVTAPEAVAPAAVVLANVDSCSPEESAALVERGCRVLVLTPALQEDQRARYLEAGAGYALMEISNLIPTVRAILLASERA